MQSILVVRGKASLAWDTKFSERKIDERRQGGNCGLEGGS